MSFPKQDVHAHFLPEFYREALKETSHIPGPDGINSIPEWSPQTHIAFNESNNIKKSYLSISSPGTCLTPLASAGFVYDTVRLTRRVNGYGRRLKHEYPSNFGFFASLPLPLVEDAVTEIQRLTGGGGSSGGRSEEDGGGLPGVDGFVLMSNAHGLYFGDAAMRPVWEALNEVRATVFIHPTMPCPEAYCLLVQPQQARPRGQQQSHTNGQATGDAAHLHDRDDPIYSPTTRRRHTTPLASSYPVPMLQFLYDTTTTVSDLLLSDVPSDYPYVKFIIPHGGSALPSVLDRVVRFSRIMGNNADSPRRNMASLTVEGVKRVFRERFLFDLAGISMGSQIRGLLEWVGHEGLCYGSDVPFTPWTFATELEEEFVDGLVKLFGGETGAQEIQRVCCGNVERVLGEV